MKDYKLSELKEICNTNHNCNHCPLCDLCQKLDGGTFSDLQIDEEVGE